MRHPLAALDTAQNAGLFFHTVRRKKQSHGAAEHFFGRVSVNPLGGFVPGVDAALEVLADDSVVGRLHNFGPPQYGILDLCLVDFCLVGIRLVRHRLNDPVNPICQSGRCERLLNETEGVLQDVRFRKPVFQSLS